MKEMTYAELIAKARGERSLKEFAIICGIDPSTISILERNKHKPTFDTMKKICKASQGRVQLEDFIGNDAFDLYMVGPTVCKTVQKAYEIAYKTKEKIYKCYWENNELKKGDEII